MWLTRYPLSTEIKYYQVSEFIGHEFRIFSVEEEYGITAKKSTSGNPTSNAILERIHQVIGNLVRTYNIKQTNVDKDYPCSGILAVEAFAIR